MGVQRTIIRPHPRDNQLSPIPVDFDPDTLGWILDEGGRGNLMLQNELFNTMEDTWERLRGNLNKLKNAVCKLPFNLQPWAEKGKDPSDSALEKAAFVEHVLHNQKAATWEGQHNFHATIYELLDAVARGVSVLEIDWTIEDGKYIPTGTRRVPWTCLGFEQSPTLSLSKGSNPNALRLFPDRRPDNPKPFDKYPHKFLVGIYRAKSGHIAETAQLRSLAHLWLGRMLGWEWMTHKAELFGLPIRWATYDPSATQQQIDAVTDMLRNMGTAAWGAFPQGTDLQMVHGSTPGVAGASEPTERLMYLAERACDLIFLGQTLTSSEGSSGSYALGNVHREVELDLYENYAAYVIDVINNQLIPAIIELNWGKSDELPFLEVELDRPEKDKQIVERDKTLFVDMGLPVSKQWLYDRHKVPAPGPSEDLFLPRRDGAWQRENGQGYGVGPEGVTEAGAPRALKEQLFNPGKQISSSLSQAEGRSESKVEGNAPSLPQTNSKAEDHSDCVHATSESDNDFQARKAQALTDFAKLLKDTDLCTHELVWTSGDCPVCNPLNETAYGTGWTTPPPLHHNCDCGISVRPK